MKKKMHMIGNAHLDPVWLWQWQEGFQENKATFRSALARLKEYDDVIFTSSSAQFYAWVEENDKEMFAQIKNRIKEGRWVICGGYWVQPDCNLPCGESFARHALYGQNYFKDRFGVTARTGYHVDSFGHNGMLPQILRLSGMDSYVFMRPGPHEKGLPARNFIWESADGSRVTAFQIPFSYCTFGDLQKHMEACLQEFDPNVNQLMCFYGVGNHGGGPTIANIEAIKEFQTTHNDVDIVFSDPNQYFEELAGKQDSLPVVHGDLQHHASGCYSAQSEIKTMNRLAENRILRGEKFSSAAAAIHRIDYPLNYPIAWKDVLFNQFHDILAGSSIQKAYEDAHNELGEALAIAARNENNAVQAISFAIGIEQEANMLPVVVFNPHSWEVMANVEVETGQFLNQRIGEAFCAADAKGNPVPVQRIASDAKSEGRNRLVFRAKVPPLGYTVYRIYGMDAVDTASVGQGYGSASNVLENPVLRVLIDEKTGGIRSIYQKQENVEYLAGTGALPVVIRDNSDTWSHDVTRFDEVVGVFKPISIQKTEEGAVRSSIRVISKYQDSTLVQTFTLYQDSNEVHVTARVNWQEKWKCLKLQFPMNLEHYKATYEIPFGSIVKECTGMEEPMQKWMDLTGMKAGGKQLCGISILNENKYSASVTRNIMAMTILRSPVYAHHTPYILQDEIEDYQFIDQGIQDFNYVILPHLGSWKQAGTVQKAYEQNQPCVSVIETYHEGDLLQEASNIRIDAPNVILSSLKKAEASEQYVLRVYEIYGETTETVIDLPLFGKSIQMTIKPNEIKSFVVDADAGSIPYEVNFMEWEIN